MNSNEYMDQYFCYFCGNNHYCKFNSTCEHYVCKNCYLKGHCLLCNNNYFKEQCEKYMNNNQLTSKKRKFKDIEIFLEFNDDYYFTRQIHRMSKRMNIIIDEMINDFELLDYSLLKKEIKEDNCKESFNQILKRGKLY